MARYAFDYITICIFIGIVHLSGALECAINVEVASENASIASQR